MKVFFKSGNVILNEAKEYIAGVSVIDLADVCLLPPIWAVQWAAEEKDA